MCASMGASVGLLIAWSEAYWQKQDGFVGNFLSVLLKEARRNTEWVASSIYGPMNVGERQTFGQSYIMRQVCGTVIGF